MEEAVINNGLFANAVEQFDTVLNLRTNASQKCAAVHVGAEQPYVGLAGEDIPEIERLR